MTPELPAGTVTFLATDIESSTELLQRLGDSGYAELLAEHHKLLGAIAVHAGGRQVGAQGDSFLAVFARARDAVAAAIEAQAALTRHTWPAGIVPLVRMALHTGEPRWLGDEYVGLDVHRVARIRDAGYGGQILVSQATSVLVEGGLPPGVALRDLGPHRLRDLQQAERLFQVVHSDLPNAFPHLRSLDAFPNNLPPQLTSFIGREREIAEVKHLLSTTDILMLAGSGGCGKTRLALQAAAESIERYPDGVWLVELATLAEPELLLQTVAAALKVQEVPGRTMQATFLDHVKTRSLLLVLDNCEHLITACAELVGVLTRSCPRLRILATSREPLGVPGERVWRVPSLSLPAASEVRPEQLMQSEAIKLFVERTTAVRPEFALTPHNAAGVAAVCRRLEGIPLAIELAAARMPALGVEQIAARLDERFRLLTGGGRTALPRQQTLRGALDWSYDLLSTTERALLRRLSVFAGGWTLEAAEAVCAGDGIELQQILDLLTQLIFKSLVLTDAQRDEVRYHLLETVRQYGRQKLGESGEAAGVRTRHLDWFLSLAERAQPELQGPRQAARLQQLETEHDNLRAALEWSTSEEQGAEAGLRLAGALWEFWHVRGHFIEGRKWLQNALSRGGGASAAARARARAGAGLLAWRQGDYESSVAHYQESLSLFRELGDFSGTGHVLQTLGMIAMYRGDYERAETLLAESLTWCQRAGDKRRMAVSLNALGETARCQGDYVSARASYEESLVLRRVVEDGRGLAISLGNLGHVMLHHGDAPQAARFFREALELAQGLMYKVGIAEYLAGLGGVAVAEGRYARAARLLGAAQALLNLLGARLTPADMAEYGRSVASARDAIDKAAFAEAWAQGEAMAPDQAIEYALSSETHGSYSTEPSACTNHSPSECLL